MRKTIAFDNKRNIWKTRYSFTSTCIGWIRNLMLSSPVFTSTKGLLWRHDGRSDSNNRFYGAPPVASSLALSFNDNPSANKQFKALSIETNNPSMVSGVNTFRINSGSGNAITKDTIIGPLKDKGGILYGYIGTESRMTMSNVEFAGVVSDSYPIYEMSGVEEENDILFHPAGYNSLDHPNATFIDMDFLEPTSFSSNLGGVTNNLSGVKEETEIPVPFFLMQTVLYRGGIITNDTNTGSGFNSGDSLFFVYSSLINGEAPKGQYADSEITLGNNDFEVYALNVDYELTNLDHNS